jgi:hypothetical protein
MSMGLYRTICYKVEDIFVKLLTRKLEPQVVKMKVTKFRTEKEEIIKQKKLESDKKKEEQRKIQADKRAELERLQMEKEAKEKAEIEEIISLVLEGRNYSPYEYQEIKKNKLFFKNLVERVFEPKEKAKTFIYCEFDKTSKNEIKGYLIPTNRRVIFINKNLTYMEKFRYQTIINVTWFQDGILEKGLHIQYGKRKLEFDEMFDTNQMKKVGNTILNKATTRVI